MTASVRECAVLIVDIAGSVGLHAESGHAAAERRIRHLLDRIIATGRLHGGAFIKSYGDDVLLVFERSGAEAAAQTAICAQREAAEAGLQLYAGLHVGPVEFRDTMGHPDAVGQTVSTAARLHKLTEGVPGQIFLTEETLNRLGPELRERAHLYGPRELKGLGLAQVWTLDWRQRAASTVHAGGAPEPTVARRLVLNHLHREVHPDPTATCLVGRGASCHLRLLDPETRISSTHLQVEFLQGCWMVQDVSRNGTWLREDPDLPERRLPFGLRLMLPSSGRLCLGRPFDADPGQRYVVGFQTLDR